MKVLLPLLLLVVTLASCTSSVKLKHPETGKTVKCGPYHVGPANWGAVHTAAAARERGCVEDFKQQGYVRMP